MTVALDIAGLVATAALFGSMAFFSVVVAPLVFVKLDAATAARFIRGLFPWYYLVIGALAALAAAAFAAVRPYEAAVLLLIALLTAIARQILMPRINALRDRMLAGESDAERGFNRLHRLSVWINALQLLASLVVLVRLGLD